MNILIYACPEAAPKAQFCAVTMHGASRMPVVHYGVSREAVTTAAHAFWDEQADKAAKRNAPRARKVPVPAVELGDVI